MPSTSHTTWSTERMAVLADLERAHRLVRGSGAGARAAGQQINQAYVVTLSAQFQAFCRDLHSECVDVLVGQVSAPDLRQLVHHNLLFGRRIDRGNPNSGNLGADFNRLELPFWSLVDAHRLGNPTRRAALDELNEWRNAVAHQDFRPSMLTAGRVNLGLAQVRTWRRACVRLARSFDDVLHNQLTIFTGHLPGDWE